jgi:hypothetical protein
MVGGEQSARVGGGGELMYYIMSEEGSAATADYAEKLLK